MKVILKKLAFDLTIGLVFWAFSMIVARLFWCNYWLEWKIIVAIGYVLLFLIQDISLQKKLIVAFLISSICLRIIYIWF